MHVIIGELRQPRFVFLLRFAAMADFGFEPGNFGVGIEQSALGTMHAVARGEVRFARFFKTGFGFAKRGVLRLEVDHRALDFARQTLAFSLRLVTA